MRHPPRVDPTLLSRQRSRRERSAKRTTHAGVRSDSRERLAAMLLRRGAVLVAVFALVGCGRGEARFGQPCTTNSDCQRGLCVAGVAGEAPVCTTSCGSRADCPPEWACNGVTQANVVVCSRGASTPFGEGTR